LSGRSALRDSSLNREFVQVSPSSRGASLGSGDVDAASPAWTARESGAVLSIADHPGLSEGEGMFGGGFL
jgi:hypothetical protein